jgi:hypothetical protein
MVQQQDSSDPTGVSGPPSTRTSNGGSGGGTANNLALSRSRKAAAALQMRLAGATWHEICKGVGYPTPRSALVAVERALVKELDDTDDREKLRRLAGARLDRLLRSAWPKAINPDHPEHLIALTKCREVINDHRRLFGLDAPTEVIVHNPSQAELEAWVGTVLAATTPALPAYDIFEGELLQPDEGEPDALPAGP